VEGGRADEGEAVVGGGSGDRVQPRQVDPVALGVGEVENGVAVPGDAAFKVASREDEGVRAAAADQGVETRSALQDVIAVTP